MNRERDKRRGKELEFKYLYFKIQKLLNKQVNINLKYEQLKQPEINLTLVKPLSVKIQEMALMANLVVKIGKLNYNLERPNDNKISLLVIHILLLIKYEFVIQSERNLINYDLLKTKALVCEILAIRLLREYKSFNRVNLLFENPLNSFNTIELAIMTKSKKFLSQPIIMQIFDKFYQGELIINQNTNEVDDYPMGTKNMFYRYNRVTFNKISERSTLVPKYQSLVINCKNIVFTILNILLILDHHGRMYPSTLIQTLFWIFAVNYNWEFLSRIIFINHQFLKKILWFYVDFFIVLIIDIIMISRILLFMGKIDDTLYFQVFSFLSIILIPRNLSIFNNYEFFNLILLSFKKMIWNMVGLFFLFLSIISGFYVCFISLNFNRSNYDIAFDMLKIFFGFTPAIWSNWETYNTTGKFIQILYLFLSQFVIATILAIVLSDVFSSVSNNIKEDFEYFKAINLIIYFKTSKITINRIWLFLKIPILVIIFLYEVLSSKISQHITRDNDKHFTFLHKDFEFYNDNELTSLDMFGDETDLSLLIKSRKGSLPNNNNNNNNNNIVPSGSIFGPIASGTGRRYSQVESNINANSQFAANPSLTMARDQGPSLSTLSNQAQTQTNPQPNPQTPGLVPIQSISTLGNFKSASTDSLFIDDLLSKKYGNTLKQRKVQPEYLEEMTLIINKLNALDNKIDKLDTTNPNEESLIQHEINQSILDDTDNHSVNLYNIPETSMNATSFDDVNLIYSDDTFSDYNSDNTF